MHRRRVAPAVWALVLLASVTAPVVVLGHAPASARGGGMREASLVTALGAASLLLATYALPSRVRAFTSLLGIERLLRSHRALALVVLVLVLLHVVFVVAQAGQRAGRARPARGAARGSGPAPRRCSPCC